MCKIHVVGILFHVIYYMTLSNDLHTIHTLRNIVKLHLSFTLGKRIIQVRVRNKHVVILKMTA